MTAKSGSQTATTTVQVVTGASGANVQLGSPAGTGFTSGVIAATSTSLSAGGSTTLTVALQQSDGTLYSQSASVAFTSTCAGTGQAKITSPVTTTTGVATATYVATGCSITDPVTATATVGANTLTATANITVAPASIGSIVATSPTTPTVIALKGSGSSAHPETAAVVFTVLDQSGNPVSGAQVKFSLNTTVGGLAVTAGPVTSDANGHAQTTVQAGTVATPVRVTATVLNTTPTISTQSSQLSVSTGIPTQNEFSMAIDCFNTESFNYDGVQSVVTVRLADRFSNPVADGTAVQFNAQGGHIQPSCTTATTASEGGVCSVTWTSADPRPTVGNGGRAGRVQILAMAIGEESFVDANGNGMFDPGESFTDLSEGFRDDNGNGVYDVGEFFYDFNSNGMRDGPDGIFNGVLCNDPNRCDSSKTSAGITAGGLYNTIIMSTSGAVITANGSNPSTTLTHGAAGTFAFLVKDLNGNPMPHGTTITLTSSNTSVATVSAPSTYTEACATEPNSFAFNVATVTAGATTLTVTVTSPKQVVTLGNYNITVN